MVRFFYHETDVSAMQWLLQLDYSMQYLSPSCLCNVFVKIFNDNDKIVVASLKCSDDDSCDCNYDEGTKQNFNLQRHKKIIKEKMAREGGTGYNAVYYQ